MNIYADYVDFTGNFIVSWNKGNGALFRKGQIFIHSGTQINVFNNIIRKEVLSFANCTSINIIGDREFPVVINFINNTVTEGGVLPIRSTNGRITNAKISFLNNTSIDFDNTAGDAAVMLLKYSAIQMNDSTISFIANSYPLSGGLTMVKAELDARNISANFELNLGSNGGGISLYEHSHIIFLEYCYLKFHRNTASSKGGAIFVKDSDYINSFTKLAQNLRALFFFNGVKVDLDFTNNQATLAGTEIYGGWIDILDYGRMYNISQDDNNLSIVTSNPTRVCLCDNSIPDCSILMHRVEKFPGEAFEIEAAAIGQRMGVVPSIIIAQSKNKYIIDKGQDVQSTGKKCTILQYKVRSLRADEVISLRAQDLGVPKLDITLQRNLPSNYHVLFQQFSIIITMKNCPIGFVLDRKQLECVCSPFIKWHKSINCDFVMYSVTRTKELWLNARFEDNTTNYKIIIHNHCPYDYCRSDAGSLNIHLERPDEQCAYNRSGVLCGACKANFSQVFGSIRCIKCSNTMIPVIIVASIMAGIVLVGCLTLLNLTVSTGLVNGIIFYANVIRISHATFFPSKISSTFMTTFIAWVNLDLGLETCFYDGADAYMKTWLQFLFPIYIWLIVITIIVASHYSTRASKIFVNNALQVLATLFLLSYAKILRTIVIMLSYTILNYSDGFSEKVWLYDGNIKFLGEKHIFLFVVSLVVLVLLSIFYTLPLVAIQ